MNKYTPTLHAIDRARHRLGLGSAEAAKWFENAMKKAKYIVNQRGNLVYEYGNMRLVVDTRNKTIITVMPVVDVSVLSPAIEREKRRITREVTRNVRAIELERAELLVEYGLKAVNKAKARNPKTQAIIQAQMNDIKAEIERKDVAIKCEKDRLTDFEKAVGVLL